MSLLPPWMMWDWCGGHGSCKIIIINTWGHLGLAENKGLFDYYFYLFLFNSPFLLSIKTCTLARPWEQHLVSTKCTQTNQNEASIHREYKYRQTRSTVMRDVRWDDKRADVAVWRRLLSLWVLLTSCLAWSLVWSVLLPLVSTTKPTLPFITPAWLCGCYMIWKCDDLFCTRWNVITCHHTWFWNHKKQRIPNQLMNMEK